MVLFLVENMLNLCRKNDFLFFLLLDLKGRGVAEGSGMY